MSGCPGASGVRRLLLLVLVPVARDIAMYLHERRHVPFVLIILGALWVYRAFGDMLSIIVSNSHFAKRSAARVNVYTVYNALAGSGSVGFWPVPVPGRFCRTRFQFPVPGSVRWLHDLCIHQASLGQDPPSFNRGPINWGPINRMFTFGGLPSTP